MKAIEQIYTKQEILNILKFPKNYKNAILNDATIDRRLKIKPNNPAFYSMDLELNDSYKVHFQHNNDEEFPKYTAILMLNKTLICRLDYHDGHRRSCKKEIFIDEMYEDLHIHLYCEECIQQRFKSEAFVLNIKQEKLINFDFKCFVTLFCKIINLGCKLDCQRGLFS
jgi:hypothetical protein